MPESQRNGSSTVKHQAEIDARRQVRPNVALRRWEYFPVRLDAAHAVFLRGMGGTGLTSYSASPSR